MTDQPPPIRRDQLPAIPPPEWEFYRWADDSLTAGDRSRINGVAAPVVRRRVTYGDWEPVTPPYWAHGVIPPGANAEDCPRCIGANLPYPWICPGHPATVSTPTIEEPTT